MVKLIKLGGTLLKEKNTYELLKDILNKEININKNLNVFYYFKTHRQDYWKKYMEITSMCTEC